MESSVKIRIITAITKHDNDVSIRDAKYNTNL